MNKILYIIAAVLMLSLNALGQQTLKGVIKNTQGQPVVGAKVSEVGESRNNTVTDQDGVFSLDVEQGGYIDINYADVLVKRVQVQEKELEISLDQKQNAIVDMGFLKRTEATQTQSVSAVYGDMVSKSATPLANNALYGLIPGLYTRQSTGWQSTAGLYVRGLNGSPLVLVDGFPRGLTKLTLEEIESVQVLKDAAATALYGARGANGVILVNTKRGVYNTFDIEVNYKHGLNMPVNQPKMANALTYVKAQEEALYYDGLPSKYNVSDWENAQGNLSPDLYPDVNWVKEGTREMGYNNQFNLLLRGGGKKVRYLSLVDYKNDFGLLSDNYTDYSPRYNSQIRSYDLSFRTNLDVDITQTTLFKLGIFGTIAEDKSPNTTINAIFQNFYKVPAAAFPVKTSKGNWGSNLIYKMNPIAQIADIGYSQNNSRFLEADMRIMQDLSMLTKGLSAELAVAYDNDALFLDVASKTYQYEVNSLSSTGTPLSTIYGTNSTLQVTTSELADQLIRASFEGKIGYDRAFNNHQLNGAVVYRQDMQEGLGINDASYRQNVMGVAGYNYAGKYMLDVVGNYYGTSVLLEGDKFRFFPAVSAAWNMAKEPFLADNTSVDLMKLRMSWGKSAIDNLSYGLGKYYWASGAGYPFGDAMATVGGLREDKFPIRNLQLETANVFNVGLDMRLWKNLSFTAEAYTDRHTNILVTNNKISSMMGVTLAKENIGESINRGLEVSVGWNETRKDFKYYANANWSLFDSEIVENGEGYLPYDYLSAKGNKVGQFYGLEAIGYFSDQADIAASPAQTFSVVRPGDVKYKDQNNDGKIDIFDDIPLGKSTSVPDMMFALNLGVEYKGFGVDAVFQGISGLTKVLNIANVHRPLMNGDTNISTWYLDDKIRWTEQTKETANVPRLSTLPNLNNYVSSSQWMEDGSFLKLRNLNVYYNLPQSLLSKTKVKSTQIYARAQNVFSIDKIKYFNCESLSLGYPDLFSVYFGLSVKF